MGGADQAASVATFEREIYPIWAAARTRFLEEVGGTELELEHDIDWRLWKSTIKPSRIATTSISAEQGRRKSAAVEKMGEVFR